MIESQWITLANELWLLDVCGLANDTLLQAKEDTRQLRSVFRRRRDHDAGFANVAKAYIASRKKANKLINKSLKDLKISKCGAHNDAEATFSMLLQSVFRYITASMPEPKSTNWSLVSKLMHSKRVTCEERGSSTNGFERVNALLCSLIGSKTKKCSENAKIELQNLESSIRDVECLMGLLIKTRVSILNTISH
ncbi:hypothetical protein V6N13_149628 [Hibiscus sabdariffa]|uniref:Uncharacterized protein n=1 Tax=Hibiscus sabdariffa TaxID=183260 RepID=A0ABR2EGT7_9ROSI